MSEDDTGPLAQPRLAAYQPVRNFPLAGMFKGTKIAKKAAAARKAQNQQLTGGDLVPAKDA